MKNTILSVLLYIHRNIPTNKGLNSKLLKISKIWNSLQYCLIRIVRFSPSNEWYRQLVDPVSALFIINTVP